MAAFKEPGWLSGAKVSFAGEFPSYMNQDTFKSMIEACDGTYQRSPINCHLLVCGEDAGERPMRAREANPDVLIWSYETFKIKLNASKRPENLEPYLFPGFVIIKGETYGSF
jgi:NAD-dependent DNA ligase